MSHVALSMIRSEHAALSAMLRSIPMLIDRYRQPGREPDFGALRAILFYIGDYAEQRHHRKESDLLFPRLRLRDASAAAVIDVLDAQHVEGERRVRELEHALVAFEMMGESRRAQFERDAERYVEFYRDHMRLEEEFVLPAADKALTFDDWTEIDQAFLASREQMQPARPEAEYNALFTRVVNQVPSPIGLGMA